ncbi:MAG: hypothetical protein ACE5JA_01325 [bacterium]
MTRFSLSDYNIVTFWSAVLGLRPVGPERYDSPEVRNGSIKTSEEQDAELDLLIAASTEAS